MGVHVFTPENTLIVESIKCYLYTDPGMGKSTIAHTADKPVIFDFDKGQHRVSAELRRGTIVRIDSWLDLENLKDDFYSSFKIINGFFIIFLIIICNTTTIISSI